MRLLILIFIIQISILVASPLTPDSIIAEDAVAIADRNGLRTRNSDYIASPIGLLTKRSPGVFDRANWLWQKWFPNLHTRLGRIAFVQNLDKLFKARTKLKDTTVPWEKFKECIRLEVSK
jgi:hypothetical protein